MSESEISETCELKQTLSQLRLCCLKSIFDTSKYLVDEVIDITLIIVRYFSEISYHKYFPQSLALQVC